MSSIGGLKRPAISRCHRSKAFWKTLHASRAERAQEEREKKPKDQTRHISKENLKAAFDALKFPVRTHSCDKAHVFSPN